MSETKEKSKKEHLNTRDAGIDLVYLGERGLLAELVEQYLLACHSKADFEGGGDEDLACKGKKGHKGRFPNIAGFCRYWGIGQGALEKLCSYLPEEYDALCSIFEDEALNSDCPPSIVGAYLKKRLNYSEHNVSKSSDDGVVIPVFEHDIGKDGE